MKGSGRGGSHTLYVHLPGRDREREGEAFTGTGDWAAEPLVFKDTDALVLAVHSARASDARAPPPCGVPIPSLGWPPNLSDNSRVQR